jgi:hypothetical protein
MKKIKNKKNNKRKRPQLSMSDTSKASDAYW